MLNYWKAKRSAHGLGPEVLGRGATQTLCCQRRRGPTACMAWRASALAAQDAPPAQEPVQGDRPARSALPAQVECVRRGMDIVQVLDSVDGYNRSMRSQFGDRRVALFVALRNGHTGDERQGSKRHDGDAVSVPEKRDNDPLVARRSGKINTTFNFYGIGTGLQLNATGRDPRGLELTSI